MHLIALSILLFGLAAAVPVDQVDSFENLDDDFDADYYPEENPGLFEGDIVLRGGNPTHKNAIVGAYHHWPNGVVPYAVHSSHNTASHRAIFQKAMDEIMNKTKVNGQSCITFVPRTNENTYIQFTSGSGCHTPIGYMHNHRSDVTLGRGCLRHGTVMHEILHALGFWHEQSRSDRDNYVTINWSNIQKGHEHNFDKYQEGVRIDDLGMPYDYGSVMHYSAYAFAIDRSKMTIIPKHNGVSIGQRTRLSDQDAKEVQIYYGCVPRPDTHATAYPHQTSGQGHTSSPHHTSAPVTTHAPVITHITAAPHHVTNGATTCSFDNGLCGWTQSTTDTMNWSIGHGRTPSANTGPHADHDSSTTAHYLFLESSHHYHKSAVLASPTYQAGEYCFRFWYNMNGNGIGSLKMYFVHGTSRVLMRTVTGNHNDIWHHATMHLRIGGSSTFHFEIEGTTGSNYHGDLAIDDVQVTPGQCTH
ncbi:hatching enzyme 1.2-like [Argopecten irradians]|uniref:hatching enzyme 1.2-like n=1 Tax=Argopecten irradians TaxID=31199 RepID=UPI00370FF849